MDYTYNLLKKDIEDGKQIVLFLGAGINYSKHKILWADVMKDLFENVILSVSSDNNLSEKELSIFSKLFNVDNIPKTNNEDNNTPINTSLLQYVYNEYPYTLQSYIVKKYLGNRYIPIIQDFLYSKINHDYIEEQFKNKYSIGKEKTSNDADIQGLFEIARLILLCPNIKAVVTYNYDNFLTQAINIIQKNPKLYFTTDELNIYYSRISKIISQTIQQYKSQSIISANANINKLVIEDIYGDNYSKSLKNNIFPIYHVHGYIPSPNEIQLEDNSIVLSMDEFYDNLRNVYCWQTDTQMHFLSHYTCIFIGSSMSDLTIQRMLYNVQQHGNNDQIYCFQAKNDLDIPDDSEKHVYEVLCKIKRDFFKSYGIAMIYNDSNYTAMYKQINELINIKHKQS